MRALGLAIVLVAAAPAIVCAQAVDAITKPSGDVKYAFVRPGIIGQVLVEPGDWVEAGTLLVKQDDQVEQAQLEEARANAEDTIRVRAAEKQLDQKKVELKKLERALKTRASTELEVERARLEVEIGALTKELEEFNRRQDALKAKQLELQIARMSIRSQISGRVEEVSPNTWPKQGESVDALAKVVRVVNLDPLWVDVPMPVSLCGGLDKGQEMQVVFSDSSALGVQAASKAPTTAPAAVKGRIKYVASVAEPSSLTRMVRLEVPNPTSRPAGERVKVVLPPCKPAPAVDVDASKAAAPAAPKIVAQKDQRS